MNRGKVAVFLSPKYCWSYGIIRDVDEAAGSVVLDPCEDVLPGAPMEACTVPIGAVHVLERDDARQVGPIKPDLSLLSDVHEGLLLQALRRRYYQKTPCVFIGDRIAIWQAQCHVHGRSADPQEISQMSLKKPKMNATILQIAVNAFNGMLDGESQSVFVKGESGSGKSEVKSVVLDALLAIEEERRGGAVAALRTKICGAEQIFECFGNATTNLSDSANFHCRLTQLRYDAEGRLSGVYNHIHYFDRSRILHAPPKNNSPGQNHRLYHAFYCLLNSTDGRKIFNLSADPNEHPILSLYGSSRNISDEHEFVKTNHAFMAIGFTEAEKWSIWGMVAGILHITKAVFDVKKKSVDLNDTAEHNVDVANAPLKTEKNIDMMRRHFFGAAESKKLFLLASFCWGVKAEELENRLLNAACSTTNPIRSFYEVVIQTCSHLYLRLFLFITHKINERISSFDPNSLPQSDRTISLLDGPGFKQMDEPSENPDLFDFYSGVAFSYEGVCVNAMNEVLQRSFNEDSEREVELVRSEGLLQEERQQRAANKHNAETCRLLCGEAGDGAEGLLGEIYSYCMVHGDDEKLAVSLGEKFAHYKAFVMDVPEEGPQSFKIRHCAAEVEYHLKNFGSANFLLPPESVLNLIRQNSRDGVAKLLFFSDFVKPMNDSTTASTTAKTHLNSLFSACLSDLHTLTRNSRRQWVCCLSPALPGFPRNSNGSGPLFDQPYVFSQLKASGCIDCVHDRHNAFSCKMEKTAFLLRYKCCITTHANESDGIAIMKVLKTAGISLDYVEAQLQIARPPTTAKTEEEEDENTEKAHTSKDWAIGQAHYVFFSDRMSLLLEDKRKRRLGDHANTIQQFALTRLSRTEAHNASLRCCEGVLSALAKDLQFRAALLTVHDKSRHAVSSNESDHRHNLEITLLSHRRAFEEQKWAMKQAELQRKAEQEQIRVEKERQTRMEKLQTQERHLQHQRRQVTKLKSALKEAEGDSPAVRTRDLRATQLLETAKRSASPYLTSNAVLRTVEALAEPKPDAAPRGVIDLMLDEQNERERCVRIDRLAAEQKKRDAAEKKRERCLEVGRRAAGRREQEQQETLLKHAANEEKRRRGKAGVALTTCLKKQVRTTDSRVHNAKQNRDALALETERARRTQSQAAARHRTEVSSWNTALNTVSDRVREANQHKTDEAQKALRDMKASTERLQSRRVYEHMRGNLLRDSMVDQAISHQEKLIEGQRYTEASNRRLLQEAEGTFTQELRRREGVRTIEERKAFKEHEEMVRQEAATLAEDLVGKRKALPSPARSVGSTKVTKKAPVSEGGGGGGGAGSSVNDTVPKIPNEVYVRLLGGAGERDGLFAATSVHEEDRARHSAHGTKVMRPLSWK